MVQSTATQVQTALFDAKLEASDINLVLLVGGSSHIPLVQRFLRQNFGFDPQLAENADLAVVRGAAIQAGVLSGVLDDTTIALTDVCPYSLSTDVLVDSGFFFGGGDIICDILIPRNTTLPAEVSKMYSTSHDDQEVVIVQAYQGESIVPSENYLLCSFSLGGIPKGRQDKQSINVRFSYDLNGILEVSAEIVSTGKSATVTVDTATMSDDFDLEDWKKSPIAKKYRRLINKAMRLVKVHGDEAKDIEIYANGLKKAIILNWDEVALSHQEQTLEIEVRNFEFYLELNHD
jgi:molecular chaperone DnaK